MVTRRLGVNLDLGLEGGQRWKGFLCANELMESDFDFLAVEVLIEVKEMDFQNSWTGGNFDGGADPDICDAEVPLFATMHLDRVDTIWRKLLVVGTKISGGEPDFFSEMIAFDHRPEDGVRTAQVAGRIGEIA